MGWAASQCTPCWAGMFDAAPKQGCRCCRRCCSSMPRCLPVPPRCVAHQPIHGCLQVLVYFAVAKKGDAPTDGRTDVNPEGLTAAYGPQAATVAARLHAAGLSCKVGA
jgi:hypothetical protein